MGRTYAAALQLLETALTSGIHPSLDGIRELTRALGTPQDSFTSVQVAGTNGKSSTARYLEAVLRAHGVRTALYTSPHLEQYPERMEHLGRIVSDEAFAEAVLHAADIAERLRPQTLGTPTGFTEFELLTAAALWLFAREHTEVAVLEVGLGGRWDSTSVVEPAVAVITGIGLDHMHILGDTLEQIAAEKAGIIAPGSTAVLGPGTSPVEAVLLARADEVGADVTAVRSAGTPSPAPRDRTVRYEVVSRPSTPAGVTVVAIEGLYADYGRIELAGPAYQAANAATAIAAAEAVQGAALSLEAVRTALRGAVLRGRFEVLSQDPPVVIDGSHNPQAGEVLAAAIEDAWPGAKPVVLLGMLADKDARGFVEAVAPVTSRLVVTQPDSARAMSADALADIAAAVTGIRPEVFSAVEEALDALAGDLGEGLVVTGSLVTAGQARNRLGSLLSNG